MAGRNDTPRKQPSKKGLAWKIRFYLIIFPLALAIATYRTIKKRRKKNKEAGKPGKYRKARVKQAQAILMLLLIVFSGVGSGILIWKIANYFIDAGKSQEYAENLSDSVTVMDDGEQYGDTEAEAEEIEIPASIDFDSLYKISKDTVAWIFAPGTKINYVIAQAKDNDYYMHRLLDGTSANGGTLFEDYRCSNDFTDWNTIIYGHHMKNGTMFAGLMDYRDPDFYEEHPVMYLYVPGKRYKLELIAGYTTNVEDMIFSVPATKKERDEIVDYACRNSSFTSGIKVDGEDRLVTMSTCSYVYTNARYVVIGRIVDE